ncbi:MAG: ABC transporter substrate-binding protein [Gemmatimonadaceae bacterium]|nr:ABC transporter substrate-binding protein [Gemmatimonadaceae bacterium]
MGGPPLLSGIVVAVVDEAATKFAGLVSGDLDIAGISPTMAHLVRNDPMLTLVTPPALFSNVLAFNTTRSPFDDRRVRLAVSLAIDRRRLVQAAVAGYATPSGSAIPPGLPMSGSAPPPLDTSRADSLLEAAGWRRGARGARERDGTPLRVELLTVGSGDMAIEQLLQADLAARGIALKIRVAELTTFLSTVRAPQKMYDVALTGIPADIGLGQLVALFSSTQRGGAMDYTGFHEPALDRALQLARGASVTSAREQWAAVDAMLSEEAPVVWLYHARGVQGLSRRLQQ